MHAISAVVGFEESFCQSRSVQDYFEELMRAQETQLGFSFGPGCLKGNQKEVNLA